jgi:copper homeostasis protein
MASVLNAIKGKAHRIELCQDLLADGLSPSSEFIKEVTAVCKLPIHVLVRPRAGNFFYNSAEIKQIEKDIKRIKRFPIQGIVIGALNKDKSLAIEHLSRWKKMCPSLDFTFHRAFDFVKDPEKAIHQLINLGYDRVLTSGTESKATEGLDLLKKLNLKYSNQITIMPGGGVNHKNAHQFLEAGFNQIHLSAKDENEYFSGDPISNLNIIRLVVGTSSHFE